MTNKTKLLKRLTFYMDRKKAFLPLSGVISFIANLFALLPLIAVWEIARNLFVNSAGGGHSIVTMAWLALLAAVLYLLLYFLALMLSHAAAFRTERNIRYRSMEKMLSMPLGFFDRHTTGELRKKIDENASLIHEFVAHQWPDLIGGLTCLISFFCLLFIPDWRMGLICLIPIVIALIALSRMMGSKALKESMTTYLTHLEKMNSEAVEFVRGMPVVKTFQQSVYSFNRFHRTIQDYRDWVTKYSISSCKSLTVCYVAVNSFPIFLIPLAVFLLVGRGESLATVLPNLVFYILITPLFQQCMMRLMFMFSGAQMAQQAVDRIDHLFEGETPLSGESVLTPSQYDISIEHVSFRYNENDPYALEDISLSIPEGATYALVGASGSGKTTLARLVARFRDPEKGSIKIGGVDISTCQPSSIRDIVGFVFQNENLFKTSLKANITYGKETVSDEEINKAVNAAQCQDIIDKFPDGLDTRLGSEGIYLSGGEQQRIALARAFLKDSPILLLDEATAFADPENEKAIQTALHSLMQRKTVLLIAHRLSSVVDADCIVVMKQGQIVEQGTHQELMDRKGIYAHMWEEYQSAKEWTV